VVIATSVSDPDWIRIQSGQAPSVDTYPDPESGFGSRRAKINHKNKNKKEISCLKCWMFSLDALRADGFICSLDVLYSFMEAQR
jgi:hypothetical protein